MDIFALSWIGFFITGFATLFIIGEILVNTRGLFGLLGISLIVVYFSVYLDTSSFIIMIIIYFTGIVLIIIDGKVLNDGTLSTLGLAGMLVSVALAAPDLTSGLYGVAGVLVGGFSSLLFLKIFKHRKMWSKLTLKDRLTEDAGYNSMNKEYERLLGEQGVTLNALRPVGTIEVHEKNYSAISNGQWIEKGKAVRIVQVDGTRILVEPAE